ncbi:methyltransferase domain-containing protein [Nonomuraea fuscirosea]|uniref:methyltransferase domain-containing protein n=1 Tax=Nonomuraea fuscirosea TaxID=1291556 RepID=UPI00371AFAEE
MNWQDAKFDDHVTALSAYLVERGIIRERDWNSRVWRTGLRHVPRHKFVPNQAYAHAVQPGEASRPIDRKANSADWWRAVYTDCAIITQREGGIIPVGDPAGNPTCSLSAPSIALTFLDELDVQDHHRVLDVGTGTGWTAAMLSWRLRERQVVTVEVDETLADTAGRNLNRAGYSPELIVGDGTMGAPGLGPFDRIHVTCGVRDIPYEWIEQTRPGGVIAMPYMPAPTALQGGQRLLLTVLEDGTARGRFTGRSSYMMLRSQERPVDLGQITDEGRHSTTDFHPRNLADLTGPRYEGALLMLASAMPTVMVEAQQERRDDDTWGYVCRLYDLAGSSWAICHGTPTETEADVAQFGERNLWEELETAYYSWIRQGQPDRTKFGMMVTPDSQYVWLDTPTAALLYL